MDILTKLQIEDAAQRFTGWETLFRENHLFNEILHRDGAEIRSLARFIHLLWEHLIHKAGQRRRTKAWERARPLPSFRSAPAKTHGKIGGMNFSRITDQLYVGTTPSPGDYYLLRELGVRLVINMRIERRPLPGSPLPVLWLPTFDNPLLPIPIRTLHRGVMAALGILRDGGGVYTHCAVGMHRSVAMGAAILIATGYSIEEAIGLIKQRRSIADPYTWYIRKRIERFAASWPCSLPGCQC